MSSKTLNVNFQDGKSQQPLNGTVSEIYNGDFSGEVFNVKGSGTVTFYDDSQYQFDSPGYSTYTFEGADLISQSSSVLPLGQSTEVTIYFYPTGTSGPVIKKAENISLFVFSGAALLAAILILNKHKKENKQVKGITTNEVFPIVLIGGAIIGFTVIKKILEKTGIWKDANATTLDNLQGNADTFWSPNFYKKYSTYSYNIDLATATTLCNNIYDSFGIFNDCEDCVMAVVRQMQTQSNWSYIVDVFNRIYGQDLLTFLRGGWWPQDRLSDADVAKINTIISQLPTN